LICWFYLFLCEEKFGNLLLRVDFDNVYDEAAWQVSCIAALPRGSGASFPSLTPTPTNILHTSQPTNTPHTHFKRPHNQPTPHTPSKPKPTSHVQPYTLAPHAQNSNTHPSKPPTPHTPIPTLAHTAILRIQAYITHSVQSITHPRPQIPHAHPTTVDPTYLSHISTQHTPHTAIPHTYQIYLPNTHLTHPSPHTHPTSRSQGSHHAPPTPITTTHTC
jgi:hypothetical protein